VHSLTTGMTSLASQPALKHSHQTQTASNRAFEVHGNVSKRDRSRE
jgi:hypothetical protein